MSDPVQAAQARWEDSQRIFAEAYEAELDERTGQFHNQLVVLVASSKLPLTSVMLVLQMLMVETVEQAKGKYLGGGG